jgi:hypothetical protein
VVHAGQPCSDRNVGRTCISTETDHVNVVPETSVTTG